MIESTRVAAEELSAAEIATVSGGNGLVGPGAGKEATGHMGSGG
jgi:hypothetical protein